MTATGASAFARRVARRYRRAEAARTRMALPLVTAGPGGAGTTTYAWRWDIRVTAPVTRTTLPGSSPAAYRHELSGRAAQLPAPPLRAAPTAVGRSHRPTANTRPATPSRPTTVRARGDRSAAKTYAPQTARVRPVPRTVVPVASSAGTPSAGVPRLNGAPAGYPPATVAAAASGPVPGWGAPILSPATVPAAPRAPEGPDLRRLAEQVAVQLERRSVAARERRGRV